MTRKTKPIVRGNIVVWPLIPRLADGVKLYDQRAGGDPNLSNIVVLPVVSIAPLAATTEAAYNDIQKIIAKTMRSQRYSKTSRYALEKLRKMNLNPA